MYAMHVCGFGEVNSSRFFLLSWDLFADILRYVVPFTSSYAKHSINLQRTGKRTFQQLAVHSNKFFVFIVVNTVNQKKVKQYEQKRADMKSLVYETPFKDKDWLQMAHNLKHRNENDKCLEKLNRWCGST